MTFIFRRVSQLGPWLLQHSLWDGQAGEVMSDEWKSEVVT